MPLCVLIPRCCRADLGLIFWGVANLRKTARKFLSDFFQQTFPAVFAALFLQGFGPPPPQMHPRIIHAHNCRQSSPVTSSQIFEPKMHDGFGSFRICVGVGNSLPPKFSFLHAIGKDQSPVMMLRTLQPCCMEVSAHGKMGWSMQEFRVHPRCRSGPKQGQQLKGKRGKFFLLTVGAFLLTMTHKMITEPNFIILELFSVIPAL